jgi:hypothetical protein
MLTEFQKRRVVFLFGCIGARLGLVYLAKSVNNTWLKLMGIISLIVGLGFLVTYLFKLRKKGIMGNEIWWDSLRPFHSFTYLTFGYLALMGINQHAWKLLLLDVTVALGAYTIHYSLV